MQATESENLNYLSHLFFQKDAIMSVTPLLTPQQHIDVDKAVQRLAAIEALSILLSLSYSDDAIGQANPQIVGSAWDGIALLAADATKALHGTV